MDVKLLILHVKYKYYDMMRKGEKDVEYRERKPYWESRIKGKKELLIVPGYNIDNSFVLKATIKNMSVTRFDDLPDYAKGEFQESVCKEFFAIEFELDGAGGIG